MKNKKTMIEAKNVSLRKGNKLILDNISFSARKGFPLGLIGPNGGGKTSLLRVLAGLLTPSDGFIYYQEKSAKIGYVPQYNNYQKHIPISTLEFVALGHPNQNEFGWKLSDEQINAAYSTINLVGLQECYQQCIYSLSGGQFQRAVFARAIVDNPSVLLLDEPTANTDRNSTEKLVEILHCIIPNIILILASHDRELLRNLCTDYICLKCKAEKLSGNDISYHFSQGKHPKF